MDSNLQKTLNLVAVLCSLPLLLFSLNFAIRSGYLGSTVREIYDTDKDASGIFWTDAESSHIK
ncbi:MAG: hypothetical protein QNJ38_23645 [Prochloraceae cyanobacterium]|nr:hypothetical protein [Prochloraceae cyanobacterium]